MNLLMLLMLVVVGLSALAPAAFGAPPIRRSRAASGATSGSSSSSSLKGAGGRLRSRYNTPQYFTYTVRASQDSGFHMSHDEFLVRAVAVRAGVERFWVCVAYHHHHHHHDGVHHTGMAAPSYCQ